ncbi:hypothetical protein FRC01_009159, partial [Tulasnella sp. 417]
MLSSKCATSSDVWSSRNSAFAFLGTKIFWISDSWALESHVLDLIHLGEGHSGAITGKLMFSSLVENANVADNTSSNQVHNHALSKRRRKAFKTEPHADVSDVGCAGHVVHLVAQDLLSHFRIASSVDETDYYIEYNRRHGLVYTAETDLELLAEEELEAARFEEEERARKSIKDTRFNQPNQESNEESDSEWEDGSIDEEGGVPGAVRSKTLNPIEKALDQYINQLEDKKSGKKRKTAKERRLRWYITPWEWDAIEQICKVLETFHSATVELSRGDIPTLPVVLPLYKTIEARLEEGKEAERKEGSEMVICEDAFEAALVKLAKCTTIACSSELHILAVVLHPSYRVAWFEDKARWDSTSIAARARVIITSKYSEYAEKYASRNSGTDLPGGNAKTPENKSSGLLAGTITHRVSREANLEELDSYFRGTFPCNRYDDVLDWWR